MEKHRLCRKLNFSCLSNTFSIVRRLLKIAVMKRNFLFLLLFLLSNNFGFSQKYNPEVTKYVTFLETQNKSAKDYVLDLFKKYDIVVVCERNHGEMTQYDLIYDIVRSPYFEKNVGNIFTEIGAIDNRNSVTKFINTKFNSEEEKTKEQLNVYRNMTFGIWEKTNFYDFIGRLNALNSNLSKNKKINLFVSNNRNPNSEETSSIENFKKYFKLNWAYGRDSIMAQNIISTFDSIRMNSKRKKALVIMNYRHAFSKSLSSDGNINTGDYLKRKYQDKFANVLINGTALLPEVDKNSLNKPKIFQDMSETLIQEGKWDASFKVLKKENLGFDFANSPFGKDSFDKWYRKNDFTYQDIFTGYVFYLPIEKHWHSFGIKNITDGYEDEIYAKNSLLMKSLGREPESKEEVKELSNVETEKYDDFEKLIMLRDQWLK